MLSNNKFENLIFFIYFLNKDVSVNIPWKFLRFEIHKHEGHLEGTVSQIFYVGFSFYFMRSRKLSFEK